MSNELVETGWKRFLDRLRQLWGKSGGLGAPAAAAISAIAETTALSWQRALRQGDLQ